MIIKKSKTKFRTEQMIAKTDCQQVSEVIWFKPCILSSSEGSRQALAKTVEPEKLVGQVGFSKEFFNYRVITRL